MKRLACVLTTINVPTVLALYAKAVPNHNTEFRFFVVGDKKTPKEAYEFVLAMGPSASICMPESGHQWQCSELIGWNSIQRRNIGFLEALKWGADAIVSVDDDNLQFDKSYFADHRKNLSYPFSGLMFEGAKDAWFDAGRLLKPQAKHRGIPFDAITGGIARAAVDAKVGVSAGLCLGDPDIDATTRIEAHPLVDQANHAGMSGVVVSNKTWTVFNSQNSAVLREFIPAWGMVPFVGRFDDIYASLVVQRVMHDRGYHVHFGQPLVWQQRNAHDLIKDLRGEIEGYANIRQFARLLDALTLPNKSVIGDCRLIWDAVRAAELVDTKGFCAMQAYLRDCEKVLG